MVIPAIDEAPALVRLIADLQAQHGVQIEIIVADGGSSDDSQRQVEQLGASWVASKPGRGRQMNCGAQRARYHWLCFVHADTRLPAADLLSRALDQLHTAPASENLAGHWPLVFERSATANSNNARPGIMQRALYAWMQAKSATGRRYTINGDQGVLISRRLFDQLGGFDEQLAFLEDQRLAERVRAAGAWQLLPGHLRTSARRFESEGAYARYALMALIMAMHTANVPRFFTVAPTVYALQADTDRLLLMPYFRLLRRMSQACGLRASLAVGWRMAGVATGELWQLVFVFDVLAGNHRRVPAGRLASAYQQSVARWAANPLVRSVVMICLVLMLFGPLQWLAMIQERVARRPL